MAGFWGDGLASAIAQVDRVEQPMHERDKEAGIILADDALRLTGARAVS